MEYYLKMIEVYKRLYEMDAVAYRGTLGAIKKLIWQEYRKLR